MISPAPDCAFVHVQGSIKHVYERAESPREFADHLRSTVTVDGILYFKLKTKQKLELNPLSNEVKGSKFSLKLKVLE